MLLKNTSRPDFLALWNVLLGEATKSGDDRLKAVLLNHSSKKEYICRKLGVVSVADLKRVQRRSKGG